MSLIKDDNCAVTNPKTKKKNKQKHLYSSESSAELL